MAQKNLGYQPHPWRAATCCTAATVKAGEGQNQHEGAGQHSQPISHQSMLEGSGLSWNVKTMEGADAGWQDG